ncbi:uncharacterized protein PRCAT00001759001 [Priceomyces carsonii]|uniref:uncharacterized protein n=1 Tax=Priceomyces carsonii TaxID=28549 RepID=UPI002ED7E40B|nr:unnamed protein product [Priceomyces carsonii]
MKTSELIDSSGQVWKLEFDQTLEQYYYINLQTNAVSFDLPCEVSRKHDPINAKQRRKFSSLKRKSYDNSEQALRQSRSNESRKRSVISKISSAFSFKTKSRDSASSSDEKYTATKYDSNPLVSSDNSNKTSTENIDSNSMYEAKIDDEYLLDNPESFRNFAGTSIAYYDSEVDSIDSEESIQSYYVSKDYDTSIYSGPDLDFDKINERREIRSQLLKELDV